MKGWAATMREPVDTTAGEKFSHMWYPMPMESAGGGRPEEMKNLEK